jgi:hypothetical protein
VRLRIVSPASKRMTVSGETFAAAANFLALKPIAALAIRHCTGSTSEPFHMLATGAVQEGDDPNDETTRTNHVEDQQTPIRSQHLSKISLQGLKRAELGSQEKRGAGGAHK